MQQGAGGRFRRGDRFQLRAGKSGIATALPFQLALPGGNHAGADYGTAFARWGLLELFCRQRSRFQHQVHPVKQGAGQFVAIAVDGGGCAAAASARMAQIAARTRIHGRDQLEAGGKTHVAVHAGNVHFAALQWLAQVFQHLAVEFRQFVQKQDTTMRQRDLARTRITAASDQGGSRGVVMRRTVGALAELVSTKTAG